MNNIPRPEHPRPQMFRNEWMNLNGKWSFEIDNARSGRERSMHTAKKFSSEITVPFCPESSLSGIGNTDFMLAVWYTKFIDIPHSWRENGKRTLLHFGACDYHTEVWVNGTSVGTHIGGFISFSFDITDYLTEGENQITVCATDDTRAYIYPSGKQSARYESFGCMYTRTTGIWQTVWLENVPKSYIAKAKYTGVLENKTIYIEAVCCNAHGKEFKVEAYFEGKPMGSAKATVVGKSAKLALELDELYPWNVGEPNLYDLKLTLGDDVAESYFGMREIAYVDGKILLNGKPVYQRLILDQGYNPWGIMTAPSDEELKKDIERALVMGFNGARLHQKVFEERFLYHCDKMGYIVWGEHGNWGLSNSRPEAWEGFMPEWLEIIERDYNHPAIVGWCPLNETGENQNKNFVKMLVDMTHAYDSTRPIIDASGWSHVGEDLTDIMDCHDYEQNPEILAQKLEPLKRGEKIKMHNSIIGFPTFMSEYGGIWWNPEADDGWGYGDPPKSEEEFLARFKGLTEMLLKHPKICAFCYTQLTDIEQEQNGLYTYDRKPKFDPEIIAPIVRQKAAIEE